MNKQLLFVLSIGFATIGLLHASDRRDESYQTLEVTAASATVWSNGEGWVKGVSLSTPTESSVYGRDWLVILDTTVVSNINYSQFTSATKKSLPLIYTSTPTTIATNQQPNTNVFWFPEPGIRISSACFVFKTQAASGEAFKAIIHYKR